MLQQPVECSAELDEFDYGPIVQGLPPAFIFGTASAAYQASKPHNRVLDMLRVVSRTPQSIALPSAGIITISEENMLCCFASRSGKLVDGSSC